MVDNVTGPIIKGGKGLHLVPPLPSAALSPDQLAAKEAHTRDLQRGAWRKRMTQPVDQRVLPVALDLPSNWYQTEDEKRESVWMKVSEEDALSVDVIRMPLAILFEQRRIPDALTPMVREFIGQIESKDPDANTNRVIAEFEEDPETTYNKWLSVLRFSWLNTVVRPRFVDVGIADSPDDEIYSVEGLDYFDMLYVYSWAQGVDQSVRDFLLFQGAALGTLGSKSGVLDNPGAVVRIERRGGAVVDVSNKPGGVDVGEVHRVEDEPNGGKASAPKKRKR